jgi:hypothetical protein
MTKKISYFFLLTFLGIGQIYAQISQKAKEINTDCLKKFATLKPSQQDKSEQGIPYSVIVLREGSTWIVAVIDTGSFYSFRKMRKVDTLTPNSSAFDLNLCKLLEKPERFVLKEKKAKIGDLEVPHYYTFNNEGGKRFGAIQQAETGVKNLSAIGKGLAFIGNGIVGIFSIFKPTKLLKQVDGLKKQITDQEALLKKQTDEIKKQTDEMKKQTDVIKKQSEEVKKLQDETAKLKKEQEDAIKAQEQAKADLEKAKEDAKKQAGKDSKAKKDEKKDKKKEEKPEIKKEEKKEEPKKEEKISKETSKDEDKKEEPKKEDETAKITNVQPEEDLSKLSKKERKKRQKELDKKRKETEKINKKNKKKTELNLKPYNQIKDEKKQANEILSKKYDTENEKDTTKPKKNNKTETIKNTKNDIAEDSVQAHIEKLLTNIDVIEKKYALEQQKLSFEAQRAELLRKQRELETGKEETQSKETITLQTLKTKHFQSLKDKVSELDDLLIKIKNSDENILKFQIPDIRKKRQDLKKEIAIFEEQEAKKQEVKKSEK